MSGQKPGDGPESEAVVFLRWCGSQEAAIEQIKAVGAIAMDQPGVFGEVARLRAKVASLEAEVARLTKVDPTED